MKNEEKKEQMRAYTSINIANKNNQTVIGSPMVVMVFAYLVVDY